MSHVASTIVPYRSLHLGDMYGCYVAVVDSPGGWGGCVFGFDIRFLTIGTCFFAETILTADCQYIGLLFFEDWRAVYLTLTVLWVVD